MMPFPFSLFIHAFPFKPYILKCKNEALYSKKIFDKGKKI